MEFPESPADTEIGFQVNKAYDLISHSTFFDDHSVY